MEEWITILIINIFLLPMISSYKYKAIPSSENFITPCEGNDKKFYVDRYFDLSNLTFSFDEEEFVCHGNLKVINEIPASEVLEVKALSYQKKHGQWIQTLFSFSRLDFCKRALDENEVWYDIMKQFKNELQVCPPKLNTNFVFDNVKGKLKFNFDDRNLVGTYKIINLLVGKKTKLCFQSIVEIVLDE